MRSSRSRWFVKTVWLESNSDALRRVSSSTPAIVDGGHVPEALLEGLPLTPCKVCLRISFDTDLCLGFKLPPTGNQGPRNPLKHPRVPDDWSCLDLFRGSHLES